MARISAAEKCGHVLRHIKPAVARQPRQHRVGKSKHGRFPAGTHILHRHMSIAAAGFIHGKWLISALAQSHFCRAVDIRHQLCEREVQFHGVLFSSTVAFVAGLALTGFMLAAAGCQSSDNGILNLASARRDPNAPPPPQDPKVLASQLLAYCPKVTLRDGTAFFNTYAKGAPEAEEEKAEPRRMPRPQRRQTAPDGYHR